MTIDDFALLLEMVQGANVATLYQCPVCGSAVGELGRSINARTQHILYHASGK